ncbi:MAG: helix-turn-helix domain-containing protein [Pseudomonadota bacterium]
MQPFGRGDTRMTATAPEDERLLTRPEVAERYGISRRYLEIAVVRGEGPPLIRIGRSVRYRSSDVEAWIEAQRVVPQG